MNHVFADLTKAETKKIMEKFKKKRKLDLANEEELLRILDGLCGEVGPWRKATHISPQADHQPVM
jgi:hypothetical protein